MIYFIKKTLYKILPESTFLNLLHIGFYTLYRLNILKGDPSFKYHYAVRYLVKDTDHVVDLGANLGYFAKTFARTAKKGSLTCIEPIPAFNALLKKKLLSFSHVKVLHTALGQENGEITMVLPKSGGIMRTGLPHVMTEEEKQSDMDRQVVPLTHAGELFAGLDKIDYIKCDIEGYEWAVFQLIKESLEKHQPTIQVEIGPENRTQMNEMLSSIGYKLYGIAAFKVCRDSLDQKEQGDFLYVHESKVTDFENRLKSMGKLA